MEVNKEQEIKNVIGYIEQSVWNGRDNTSKGYVIDLSNTSNKIEIWAEIVEKTHESFSTEAYFKIENKLSNEEEAIKQYTNMKKPYIFNLTEFNNLSKLPEETQKMFINNLLELETKLDGIQNNSLNADSTRVKLFKKQNEKDKLYKEKQKTEKPEKRPRNGSTGSVESRKTDPFRFPVPDDSTDPGGGTGSPRRKSIPFPVPAGWRAESSFPAERSVSR